MYNLIKKQIATDYFNQRFSNDGQRFVGWYLRNILFRDMNETRDDITDGAGDKQIDAIIIDNDNSLIRIVQGKFIPVAPLMPNLYVKCCHHGFKLRT